MSSFNKVTEERKDQAWKLRAEGLGYRDIAEQLGIAVSTVGRILNIK